ncbi:MULTISPECIES: hypothetical protein [Cellulomonas]|uniref:hypothetical protein n=1 Tax=Cellulomonas TaxID=1707 RepID=UPI001B94003A|nr:MULTISPECIES: hypothetical protein [Cellulomonas]VTR75549.1 hypothetical protein CHMI_00300 [Cellulomonas hominis]
MTWSETAVVVVAVLLLVLWWSWVAASRIDRLHRKVVASRAVVDTQLLRRASAASTLAASGVLDPVSSVLIGEASWASIAAGSPQTQGIATLPAELGGPERAGAPADRGLIESELSSTLREALDDPAEVEALREEPGAGELLDALGDAWYRVQLARRFHNEAVAQAQRMRRGWAVRTLRLAGRAPMPETLELDDAWPPALGRPGRPPAAA